MIAALPPDVRKVFDFPKAVLFVSLLARRSLATIYESAGSARQSLTAHRAAKPQALYQSR
ncbi:MAG TPA: hypothetical protein DC054_11435 [Blastocatellia bacterium]|nr:hypothetical protein [Blastocatellia bacterium]